MKLKNDDVFCEVFRWLLRAATLCACSKGIYEVCELQGYVRQL